MENIARNIKTFRLQMGLSQAELAALLNVSKATVCNYERGASVPSGETLAQLSQIMDKPISRFFICREELESLSAEDMTGGGLSTVTSAYCGSDGTIYLTVRDGDDEQRVAYHDFDERFFRIYLDSNFYFMEKSQYLPEDDSIIFACVNKTNGQFYTYSRCGDLHRLQNDTCEYLVPARQLDMLAIQRA